jgi:transcriptional regulator NrdR family protein
MRRDRDREPDYEIGYGKPPIDTRSKPGASGNPSGRPKGAKNLTTLVHEALNELVIVAENGRRRKVSKRQAIIKQLINRSAQGDLRATQMLLGVMQEIERRQEATEPAEITFDAADTKVLDQLIARLGKTQGLR